MDIPCGCDQRKEIMGAGNWQNDAIILAGVLLVVICVIGVKGL